jgi:hypothetical protein
MKLSMRPPTFTLFMTITALFLIGCVPDSATKWKEDAPQVAASPAATDAPSSFYYSKSEYDLKINSPIEEQFSSEVTESEIRPTIVNEERTPSSFAMSACQSTLELRGVYFNTTTGGFYGTPNGAMAPCTFDVTANIPSGAGGGGGTETVSNIIFGIYPELVSLAYDQTAKMILTLGDFADGFTINDISEGDYITTSKTGSDGDLATVDYVDSSGGRIFITRTAGHFDVEEGVGISSDAFYVVSNASISAAQYVFNADGAAETLDATLTTDPENITNDSTVLYSSLPLPTGISLITSGTNAGRLTIDTTQISSLAPTTLTLYAENNLGNTLSNITLSVISAPTEFSYTRDMIITTESSITNEFFVGSKVGSSYEGNATGTGKVLEVIDSTHLLVSHATGEILADYDLDRVIPYISSKGRVGTTDPVRSSAKLTLSATVTATSGTITSDSGGEGVVTHGGGGTTIVYVRVVSGSFIQAEGIDFGTDTTQTISNIVANHIRLATASAANFVAGEEIMGGTSDATGIVDSADALSVYVSSFQGDNGFVVTDTMSKANPVSGSSGTVTAVSTDRIFIANRMFDMVLTPALTTGSDIVYSIDRSLPQGMELDAATGVIAGTPSEPMTRTDFTVTAKNAIGDTSFEFALQVRDVFSLTNTTPDADSYILHREGEGMDGAACLLTMDQVNSSDDNDVLCRLEVGELDLYESGVQWKMNVGGGMCNHVRFVPFYFNQYEYKQSAEFYYEVEYSGTNPATSGCQLGDVTASNYQGTFDAVNGAVGVGCPVAGVVCADSAINGGAAPTGMASFFSTAGTDGSGAAMTAGATNCETTEEQCIGDYSDDGDGPNCDDGAYQKVTITCVETDVANSPGQYSCTSNISTMDDNDCGGKPISCMAGPGINVSDDASKPHLGKIVAAIEGEEEEWTLPSPESRDLLTNLYLANYTQSSECNGADGHTYISGDTVVGEANGLGGAVSVAGGLIAYALNGGTLDNPTPDPTNPFRKMTTALDIPPNPFYQLLCLDAAYDIKARIRVQIREWDRNFNPASSIDFLTDVGTQQIDVTTPLNYSQVDDWDDYQVGGSDGFFSRTGGTACSETDAPVAGTGQDYQLPAGGL